MTYQDDPNRPRQGYPMTEDRSYTGWIIGGIVALVVIIGIFAMTGRTDKTNTAADTPSRPTATAPATSGSAVPAPNSGQGTAGAPRQTAPATPAR